MPCYQNLLGIFPNFFDFKLNCGYNAEVKLELMAMPQNLDAIITTFELHALLLGNRPLPLSPQRARETDVRFCEISDAERITGAA